MFDRDTVVACPPTEYNSAPKIVHLWGRDYEVIYSFECPPIPPEFIIADGRLDLARFTGSVAGMGCEQD